MSTSTKPPAAATRGSKRSENVSSGKTLALVGVFLAVAIMLVLPVRSWLAQRASLGELRTEIAEAQDRVNGLQRQRDQWQSPQYVEEQARLRLNYVRLGEIGLMTLPDGPGSHDGRLYDLPDTWWGQLWKSVDESSGRRPVDIESEVATEKSDAPR